MSQYIYTLNESYLTVNDLQTNKLLVQGDFVNDFTVKNDLGNTYLNVDTISGEVSGVNLNFDNVECKELYIYNNAAADRYLKCIDATGHAIWEDLSNSTVTSIQGTANQILANGLTTPQTGDIVLTLPQDINTTSSPTFVNITGTLQTASQPNVTTLASVTSLNSIPISANTLGNSSTSLITGALQITTSPAAGRVLTSDASGNGTWQTPTGGVSSITGTANQVIVGGTPSVPVLSTPQDIGTSSNVQFNNVTAATALNGTANFNGSAVQLVLKNNSTGTGALEEAQVLNSANLGVRIGVTSPLYTGWLGDAFIYNSNNAGIAFGSNNAQRLYLSAAGNFGVGAFTNASPPLSRCHVQNDTNGDTNLRVRNLNAGSSAFSSIYLGNDGANVGAMFLNSSTRSADGGTNTMTIRNDAGRLRLQSSGSNGIEIEEYTGAMFTNSGRLELSQLGTGDRATYVDLHSSGTPSALDYSARLIRNAGVNGTLDLINTGAGNLNLTAANGIYRFSAIGGGSATSYMKNAAAIADFVQTAGSHQIRQYVDTDGVAINGTIGNTALQLRTNDVTRMTFTSNTPQININGTTWPCIFNYSTNQDLYLRPGLTAGSIFIGDKNANSMQIGNGAYPVSFNASTLTYNGATARMLTTSSLTLDYTLQSHTVAHGLGAIPTICMFYLECTTTQFGYAVGDTIPLNENQWVSGNNNFSFWFNGTNIGYSRAGLIVITNRASPYAAVSAATANWAIRVRYYRNI